jgi:hypothetical protein
MSGAGISTRCLSLQQVADCLGISPQNVRKFVRKGVFAPFRLTPKGNSASPAPRDATPQMSAVG